MTKAELVSDVARRTGLTKKEVALVINEALEVMKEALVQRKERIELRGFGVFEVRKRKRRVARNPRTKEPIAVPERWVVVFKASKVIKEEI